MGAALTAPPLTRQQVMICGHSKPIAGLQDTPLEVSQQYSGLPVHEQV